jgi:hypothetical protein
LKAGLSQQKNELKRQVHSEEKLDEINARLEHSPQTSCTGDWGFKFQVYCISEEELGP